MGDAGPSKSWGTPVTVSLKNDATDQYDASYPHVGMDDSGNAIVTWQSRDFTNIGSPSQAIVNRIYYATFTSTGWGSPAIIQGLQNPVTSLDLAMNPAGQAFVLCPSKPAWIASVTSSAGLGKVASFSNLAQDARYGAVALDPAGNGFALLTGFTNGSEVAAATNTTAPSTWSTPALFSPDPGYQTSLRVAALGNGEGLAVWMLVDNESVLASHYTAGNGWSTPATLSSGRVGQSDVATDGQGNAVAVWTQSVSGGNSSATAGLYENTFSSATGWGSPTRIEAQDEPSSVQIIHLGSGNYLATWHQHDGTTYKFWAAERDATQGWQTAVMLDQATTDFAETNLASDRNGGAALVLSGSTSATHVGDWLHRYQAGAGVIPPEKLTFYVGNDPWLAMDSQGEMTLVSVSGTVSANQFK